MSRSSSAMPANANSSYIEEMEALLFKTKDKPSNLKPKVKKLIEDRLLSNKEQHTGPFVEFENKLYVERKTQQMLVKAICSRSHDVLDEIYAAQAINLPINITTFNTPQGRQKGADITAALNKFKAQYIEDYTRALGQTRAVSKDLIIIEGQNSACMSKEAVYLWQAFRQADQKLSHYQMLKNNILSLLSGPNRVNVEQYVNRIIGLFEKLYQLQDELKKLDLVGLYAYRYHQHLQSKNGREVVYMPEWKKTGDPIQVKGFAAATTDYRNQFKRIILLQTLNKSSAFDTYSNLTALLSLEEQLSINPALTQAIPANIIQNILSWSHEAIFTMTHKINLVHEMEINGQRVILATKDGKLESNEYADLEDTLVGFTTLVEAEQSLKETFRFAELIIQATISSKGNVEATLAVTSDEFNHSFKASSHEPLSYEEVLARDKKRQKELEQARRQEREVKDKLVLAHSFTQQLANENMQKAQEMKQSQKDALLLKITSLPSHKRRLLTDLLDTTLPTHNRLEEKEVMALLKDLELAKPTKKGFIVQAESVQAAPKAAAEAASSSSSVTSTHRDHSDGKLDANFVDDIRQIFEGLDISAAALETQFKTFGL
jgi:hypothetical protein